MELKRYDIIFTYEETHWWYKGRRVLLDSIAGKLSLSKKAKILDIGCGSGFTLHTLSKYGLVYGVDINAKAVKYTKGRGFKNIKLLRDPYKLPYRKNSFDLITCLDVLEHIKDDGDYLKEVYRVLKPKGKLILYVPAFPAMWSKLDILSHHHRRYTKEQLISKLKNSRFKIETIKYFNYIFFPFIFLIRILQKKLFSSKNMWGINPVVGSRFINSILAFIFYLDVRSIKLISPPAGVSILAVVRK